MWLSELKAIRLLLISAFWLCPISMQSAIHQAAAPDTIQVGSQLREYGLQRSMSLSAFPVELKQMGRALRIKSNYNQILPIYTENGVLYMAMRLTRGINWLNGLPRGKYFINNHPITIN